MIEIQNLSTGYGHTAIVKDVSARFEKGRITCILGPNGSGKSTLLRALVGGLEIMSGDIRIENQLLKQMNQQEVARNIAYLSQGRTVPEMTVEQLVLHGRFPYLSYPRRYRKQDREIAVQAMEQMGIANMADKRLAMLSGGMRQSAYIAMALAQSTDYILMDEPTTYLDIANQLQLMQTVKQLAEQGKGVVIVLHDLPLAMEYADAILVMQNGQIVHAGSPDHILEENAIQKVYGVTLKKTADDHYYYEHSLV